MVKQVSKLDSFDFPFFHSLTEDEKSLVIANGTKRTYKMHDLIYRMDDPADRVFILQKGVIKLETRSNDGKETIKELLYNPSIFGLESVSGISSWREFAFAKSHQVEVYEFDKKSILDLMATNFTFCKEIMSYLTEKIKNTERRLEAQVVKNARSRVLDFIKESGEQRGIQVGYELLVKRHLTQQEIANITGTSRQTVTEVFRSLKDKNLIYFNRNKILIRDILKLV